MVNVNQLLVLSRTILVGFVTFLSVVVLGISAHLIYLTTTLISGYWYFAALALATAVLSIVTLPAMYVISLKRQGAFPTYIAVEVAWFWILWILWVAAAGSSVWVNFFSGNGVVSEAKVVEAFSFLNWLALMFYTTTLFIVAITCHVKGANGVWTSSVQHFDFDAVLNKPSVPQPALGIAPQMQNVQQPYYPPQQPQVVPPQQVYTPQTTGGFSGHPVNAVPQAPQV